MAVEIKLRPHITIKDVFGVKIEKSFNQDFVDILRPDGNWQHIGYFSYPARFFSPICLPKWDNAMNPLIAAEIQKKKGGGPVGYVDAPPFEFDPELTEVYEDDESD